MSTLENISTTIIPQKSVDAYLQAQSINIGGLVLRQDFEDSVRDYSSAENTLWNALNKRPAKYAKIQEVRDSAEPVVGFVERTTLASASNAFPPNADLSDAGQEVKAVVGILNFGNFSASLDAAQGSASHNSVARKTEKLIRAVVRSLGRCLIYGNATANPLEFNGLDRLMFNDARHVHTLDITGANPPKVSRKISRILAISAGEPVFQQKITHIVCSPAGGDLLNSELDGRNLYYNQSSIIPGVNVPAISGSGFQEDNVQIIRSRFVTDTVGTGGAPDTLTYYLFDKDMVPWYGLFPAGGSQTYEPQLFDVISQTNDRPLLQQRMVLLYGTPFAENAGRGIYKLTVTAPSGTGISYA